METRSNSFKQSSEFKRGRRGEKLIEASLQKQGRHVVRSYDYQGETDDKAPRLHGLRDSFVLPDLDVSNSGKRSWVEVKTKAAPMFYRKKGIWQHGLSQRHFEHYQRVQEITGTRVYVVFLEEKNGLAFYESLDVLKEMAMYWDSPTHGERMVFFPRKKLKPFPFLPGLKDGVSAQR